MLDTDMRPSPIVPTIDLDADAAVLGAQRLPDSRDDGYRLLTRVLRQEPGDDRAGEHAEGEPTPLPRAARH